MSEQSSEEQVVKAVYEHAAGLVRAGKSRAEVKQALEDHGLDAEIAGTVADNIFRARTEAVQKAGQKNMLVGAIWCIGGIVVTAATYGAAASSPTGGSYVVAWGAIVFGAVQFFRGVAQSAANG